MKTRPNTLISIVISLSAALLLAHCSAPRPAIAADTVRAAIPTATGDVSIQVLGDTTVATRRLINRPLTNKDVGKVLEEVTLVSPRGTSVQQRVIVHAVPKLETNVITK